MASERAVKAAKSIEDSINVMGNDEDMKYVVDRLLSMHRTLQQSFMSKIVIPFVAGMAKNGRDGWFDLRNKAATEVCMAWDAAVREKYGFDESQTISLPLI